MIGKRQTPHGCQAPDSFQAFAHTMNVVPDVENIVVWLNNRSPTYRQDGHHFGGDTVYGDF